MRQPGSCPTAVARRRMEVVHDLQSLERGFDSIANIRVV